MAEDIAKRSSLSKNLLYQTIYQLSVLLTPIVITPHLSRTLGPEGIGQYSFAYTISHFFVLAGALGISIHGSRKIATTREDSQTLSKSFSSLFYAHLLCSSLSLVLYIFVVFSFFSTDDIMLYLIMSFYLVANILDVKWLFHGMEKFKIIVLRSLIVRLIFIVTIFCFVDSKDDVKIYAFVVVFVSYFLSELALFVLFPKQVALTKFNFIDVKSEIIQLFILFVPSVSTFVLRYVGKFFLGIFSSFEQLGLYESVDRIYLILVSFITTLGDVLLPKIANLIAIGSEKTANKIIHISIRLSIIISCALAFGISAISKEFVPVFFGDEFSNSTSLLQLIAPTIIFLAFSSTIRKQYLIPHQKNTIFTISTLVALALNILMGLILIPYIGSTGAVIATLLSEFILVLIQCLMTNKEIKYKAYMVDIAIFSCIGTIMYLSIRLISLLDYPNYILFIIEIIAGAFVYIILALVILKIRKDELFLEIKKFFSKRSR